MTVADVTALDPVAAHARACPSRLAVLDLATDRRYSYAELDATVARAAGNLIMRLGPSSGQRIAMLSRNSVDMLIAQLACMRAGAVFVPLNWRLALPELADLVADCTPALLIYDAHFDPVADQIRAASPLLRIDSAAGGLDLLTESSDPASCPPTARRAFDAPATLLYTSGTSGKPKGVIVTEQSAFWGSINFILGNAVTRDSVFLCDMPMFHTAGLFAAVRTPLLAGASVLISQGFDAALTLARLQATENGITHYFAVPQMAQRLWLEPSFDPQKLGRLTAFCTGGAPNPPAQVRRFVEAGITMVDGFGMSETNSTFGMPLDRVRIAAKAGSCGLPFLSVAARIVDDEGDDVIDGQVGELWIKGPNVTPGYWNREAETAKAFVDGWFRTGDAARRDADGFYWLVDRKKDMFISGGENVYPAEVEAAIAELPQVAEVAVVGVPDDQWGEVGCAHIIIAPGTSLDSAAVTAHCRARLAAYKVPKQVVFTDRIPRTASGKVQKHLMRTSL